MKKLFCALLALMLLSGLACSETTPLPTIQLITPTPSPEPRREVFSSEDLIVILPPGMRILDADETIGYDTALQDDYPDTARTVLLAANTDHSAVLSFAVMESTEAALEIANEAAKAMLGEGAAADAETCGENNFYSFSCTIGEQVYRLYFLSSGNHVLSIGASGVDDASLSAMLSGLIF